MAIIRIKSESMDLSDDYTFTGTVEGAGGGIFESQLLHVKHELASTNDGGSVSIGTNTAPINTIKTNEITGASLSSNQITLPSGTYYIDAVIPSVGTGGTQAYLYSVTDGSNEIIGISTRSNYSPDPKVYGRFTTATQRVYEIRLYAEQANSIGFGSSVDQTTEVYTDVRIWKVA